MYSYDDVLGCQDLPRTANKEVRISQENRISLILSFTKFGYNETQDFIQVLHNFNEPWVFAKQTSQESPI